MAINRRDFLKAAVGSGLLLSTDIPQALATEPAKLSPDAVGILYDATLCIGCKSCMVNCKKYNSEPQGALSQKDGMVPYESELSFPLWDEPRGLSASTLNIIKKYEKGRGEHKDEVENGYSFVKQHCMHCLAPACVTACPVAALKKDPFSGIVYYEKERCIGCRYCQVACPFSIPKFEWQSNTPEIRKCQLCRHRYAAGDYAACCQYCPTGASLFGKVADLRKEASKRLGLAPGREYAFPVGKLGSDQRSVRPVASYVNHVYGMDEAGGTQYLMMSAVPFASLGLNTAITGQQYPELTWDYINKVPYFIAALLLAGGASHYFTHSKDRNEDDESQDTGV